MSYDHFAKHRKAVNLLLEDFAYHSMTLGEYADHIRNLEPDENRGLLFGTCPHCEGAGHVPNADYRDDDENPPHTPESVDCSWCNGAGFVQIVTPKPPTTPEEDMPF